MPIYNAPLLNIDAKETRRYAGLMKAKNFDERMIESACQDAMLLASPKGSWLIYDYDCHTQTIKADPPFTITGTKIGQHLAGCDKVVMLAATVGETIEDTVSKRFADGSYTDSVLLDAAATAAVEQIADSMEKTIKQKTAPMGYGMRWRFSPGYGDWPLEDQLDMIRLTEAYKIGLSLSTSLMLIPRKSITAIIGLCKETTSQAKEKTNHTTKGCANCNKLDCPARKLS